MLDALQRLGFNGLGIYLEGAFDFESIPGVIREGAVADLTVFDWNAVTDTAEFTDSVRAPRGIEHVIVAGRVALKNGVSTHSRTGGALLAKR